MKSNIITISGPSGAGKSFFVDKIVQEYPEIVEIVGLTTRKMRDGEINGKSGIFLTNEEMKRLEEENELILLKEFFGNKYAWYKRDWTNTSGFRIANISYKSINELKNNGLNIFSIFIKPKSEKQIKEILTQRMLSEKEFNDRLNDYFESERFLKESKDDFDMVFENDYDEKSTQKLLNFINDKFIIDEKDNNNSRIESKIEMLLQEDKKLDKNIKIANELLKANQHEKEER